MISRARRRRDISWIRTPRVVVSANITRRTDSTFTVSVSTVRTMPGRLRFMITGVRVTSRAPCASSRSMSNSYACGFISSRFVSSTMIRSDSAALEVSPRKTRRTFGQSDGLKVPAPVPTAFIVIAGMGPAP